MGPQRAAAKSALLCRRGSEHDRAVAAPERRSITKAQPDAGRRLGRARWSGPSCGRSTRAFIKAAGVADPHCAFLFAPDFEWPSQPGRGSISQSTRRKTAARRATRILRRINLGKSGMDSGVRPPHHQTSTQKKAQPVEVALKVPPKEEVLEECASARWAATHLHDRKTPNPMQALSAAMRHIVDLSK